MITPLLTAALLLSPQEPTPIAPPEALVGLDVEVQIQVTETHFVARNFSAVEQWVLFGTEDGQPLSTTQLAPGASVSWRFPRGSVDELRLEVLAVDSAGLANSGVFEMAAIRESDGGTLWVTRDAERSIAWLSTFGTLQHAMPLGTLCPLAWIHAGGTGMFDYAWQPSASATHGAAHVPSVTPRRVRGQRPRIRRRPLKIV